MRSVLAIPFSVRLAWTCWLVLLTAVCGRVLVSKPTDHSVVPIYRVAAERWQAGEPLYAPAPPLDVYRNPPGFAAAFSVFLLLPETPAAVFWRLLSCAVLLLALHRFARTRQWSATQTGWSFSIAAGLSVACVDNGQVNILMAACVLLGFAAATRDRLTLAAIALAIATGLKVYPVAAALLAIVVVPRLATRYILATAIIAALPFLLRPWGYVLGECGQFWTHSVLDDRTGSDFLFRVPHDWTIIPRVWFGVVVSSTIAMLTSVAVGVLFAVLVHRRRSLDLALVLGSVWMTAFGPATELPTYALLAPAVGVWVASHPSWRSITVLMLLALPIVRGIFPTNEVLMFRCAAPLGGLLLAIDAIVVTMSQTPAAGTILQARIRRRAVQIGSMPKATRSSR